LPFGFNSCFLADGISRAQPRHFTEFYPSGTVRSCLLLFHSPMDLIGTDSFPKQAKHTSKAGFYPSFHKILFQSLVGLQRYIRGTRFRHCQYSQPRAGRLFLNHLGIMNDVAVLSFLVAGRRASRNIDFADLEYRMLIFLGHVAVRNRGLIPVPKRCVMR